MPQDGKTYPFGQSYLIALGSNLPSEIGSPANTLSTAIQLLGEYKCFFRKLSPFFSTPAFPAGSGPEFINAAAEVTGPNSPENMLQILHEVEAELGRTRTGRWEARVVDLDLIACGSMVYPDHETYKKWLDLPATLQAKVAPDTLILPHPRVQDRSFVLVPLLHIAPDWVHPISKMTTRQMLKFRTKSEVASVKPLQT